MLRIILIFVCPFLAFAAAYASSDQDMDAIVSCFRSLADRSQKGTDTFSEGVSGISIGLVEVSGKKEPVVVVDRTGCPRMSKPNQGLYLISSGGAFKLASQPDVAGNGLGARQFVVCTQVPFASGKAPVRAVINSHQGLACRSSKAIGGASSILVGSPLLGPHEPPQNSCPQTGAAGKDRPALLDVFSPELRAIVAQGIEEYISRFRNDSEKPIREQQVEKCVHSLQLRAQQSTATDKNISALLNAMGVRVKPPRVVQLR